MVMEIEIKLKVEDVEALRRKLNENGARKKKVVTNIDKYYTVPHRDFMETKECLRIRNIPEEGKFIVTYKPASTKRMKDSRFFWKKEEEVEVEEGEIFENIFKALNFSELAVVHKTREKYSMGDFNIEIDKVKDVGYFMEIEKFGENPEEIEKSMWKTINKLGLSKDDIETMNYRDLVVYK